MIINNMVSDKGNKIPNQYVIKLNNCNAFQSYETVIAIRNYDSFHKRWEVFLNKEYYNYSKTTSKYRNKYLGLKTKQIEQKIKSKEFILKPNEEMESSFRFLVSQQI